MCPISEAVDRLAHDSDGDERGTVFTRREVVYFMLDLTGYTPDRPLHSMRLLEPSFGGGEFLLAAVERLLTAFQAAGGMGDLSPCIRAVELHRDTLAATKRKLEALLSRCGIAKPEASALGAGAALQLRRRHRHAAHGNCRRGLLRAFRNDRASLFRGGVGRSYCNRGGAITGVSGDDNEPPLHLQKKPMAQPHCRAGLAQAAGLERAFGGHQPQCPAPGVQH